MRTKQTRTSIKNAALVVAIVVMGSFTAYFLYAGIKTKLYIATGNRLASETQPYQQPGTNDTRILILGDSLAYGVGTSAPEHSFAGQIGARYPKASITNNARVGEDSGSLAQSLDSLVVGHYDIIFLVVGGNDISHYSVDLTISQQNLSQIYAKLSSSGDQVYTYTSSDFSHVVAIPAVLKPYYSKRSQLIRETSQQLASSYQNVSYIDAFTMDPKGYESMQAADGFHLNDHGVTQLLDMTFDN